MLLVATILVLAAEVDPERAVVCRELPVSALLGRPGAPRVDQLRASSSSRLAPADARLLQALSRVRLETGVGLFDCGAEEADEDGLDAATWTVVVRLPEAATARGELWVPVQGTTDDVPMRLARVAFEFPSDAPLVSSERFDAAVRARYAFLAGMELPGAPLFAAQASAPDDDPIRSIPARALRRPDRGFDDTFELFSGGRALQENLQLDGMRTAGGDDGGSVAPTVPVDSIDGITIRAIDFKARLVEPAPAVEPLAAWVPVDQLYVSFPSFTAMVRLLDEMEQRGDTLVQALEPRGEDARTRVKLERQIGLSTSLLARLLGPTIVRAVAFTASDPYLREGSDVALLFDCVAPPLLEQRLALGRAEANARIPGCTESSGEHRGARWTALASPDRRASSFSATIGDVVLVSNSAAQLFRLIDAHAGALPVPVMAASDEFRFFRQRYVWGDGRDAALIVLSDAFLWRFCGPAWRIGESRRLRCGAVLARLDGLRAAGRGDDATALAKRFGLACPIDATARFDFTDGGADGGAFCSRHGGAGFLTPIGELETKLVSDEERDAYVRFRDRYQSYWRQFFDPIALEVETGETLAFDLTVLPLIDGTEYADLRDFTLGRGELTPAHGDPHASALLHFIAHINPESRVMKQIGDVETALPGLNFRGLRWLGDSVELFVDDSPFWDELARAEDRQGLLERRFAELPLALRVTIRDPLAFVAFIASARAFVETSLPQMVQWESRVHQEMPYVVVRANEAARGDLGDEFQKLQICYGGVGGAFWVTPNEQVLQHALERGRARVLAALPPEERSAGTATAVPAPPASWLGRHAAATLDLERWRPLVALLWNEREGAFPTACFSNLPLLDEWHGRFPEDDPVAVHLRHFAVAPVCSSSGRYAFDAALGAIACSVHGHPVAPREARAGEYEPRALTGLARLAAGITFEHEGLRIRVEAARVR